ncbi:unnamed protein product [Lactuca saligna]|uniref:Uncharacterized protein n=1 Tax=Lactuca saligna TaxID=75948 RepID=A0AA35YKB9_LACSI|nr:unnamed protein product [Lactuca saligna]
MIWKCLEIWSLPRTDERRLVLTRRLGEAPSDPTASSLFLHSDCRSNLSFDLSSSDQFSVSFQLSPCNPCSSSLPKNQFVPAWFHQNSIPHHKFYFPNLKPTTNFHSIASDFKLLNTVVAQRTTQHVDTVVAQKLHTNHHMFSKIYGKVMVARKVKFRGEVQGTII